MAALANDASRDVPVQRSRELAGGRVRILLESHAAPVLAAVRDPQLDALEALSARSVVQLVARGQGAVELPDLVVLARGLDREHGDDARREHGGRQRDCQRLGL